MVLQQRKHTKGPHRRRAQSFWLGQTVSQKTKQVVVRGEGGEWQGSERVVEGTSSSVLFSPLLSSLSLFFLTCIDMPTSRWEAAVPPTTSITFKWSSISHSAATGYVFSFLLSSPIFLLLLAPLISFPLSSTYFLAGWQCVWLDVPQQGILPELRAEQPFRLLLRLLANQLRQGLPTIVTSLSPPFLSFRTNFICCYV